MATLLQHLLQIIAISLLCPLDAPMFAGYGGAEEVRVHCEHSRLVDGANRASRRPEGAGQDGAAPDDLAKVLKGLFSSLFEEGGLGFSSIIYGRVP